MSTDEIRAVGPAVVIGADITPGAAVRLGGTEAGDGASVVSGSPQITDTATAPLETPVALRRGADGLFRPDPGAIADRPTRTEVEATVGVAIAAHVIDPDPHPVYDNIPDLTLWFDNALI